ncbi:MAG: exodeoxyribonuclease VII small subunit, partial [Candidatus Methanomethylophilus sp.]|nr:exodeoxyribonuclease VII small subunit [Methanomethylophilus sp.]
MSDAETGKLDVEKLSFEESMSMLEELVKKLEGGNLDLD